MAKFEILSTLLIIWSTDYAVLSKSDVNEMLDFQLSENVTNIFANVITEWAYSPVRTTYLAKEEIQLYKLIRNYRNSLRERIALLERYTVDYAESTKLDGQNKNMDEQLRAYEISSHPLMTYRMIRRFAYDLVDIKLHIALQTEKPLLDKVGAMRQTFELPNGTDVDNVMENILRVQEVYELHAKDLIIGNIAGKHTGVGLTVAQAYEIGDYAVYKEIYTDAMDWFQNVLLEVKVNPYTGVDVQEVFTSIQVLSKAHNELLDTIDDTNFYDETLNRFTDKIGSSQKLKRLRAVTPDYMPFQFMDTCNGVKIKTPAEISTLYCFLNSKIHPLWTISPLKTEVHSWDPYVIQIYDAIGEKMTQYLQQTSLPELERATVVHHDERGALTPYTVSTSRTSSYAFLFESGHKRLLKLEKRIGLMAGLITDNTRYDGQYIEMAASEAIQVAVYGFGCHFSEHIDALQGKINETEEGDRIGTFMLYLNDVELGGHTAFPVLNMTVPPVKGSALFWYDLMKNGQPDERVTHGGCPVILGRKWIANKWIRHNASFRKRPCSLNSEE